MPDIESHGGRCRPLFSRSHAAVAVLLTHPSGVASYAEDHTVFVGVALAVAASAAAVLGAVTFALRRRG